MKYVQGNTSTCTSLVNGTNPNMVNASIICTRTRSGRSAINFTWGFKVNKDLK